MHKCGTAAGKNVQAQALVNGREPRSSDEEKGGERRLGRARRISSMIVPREGRSSSTDNPKERRSSSVGKPKRRSRSFPRPPTSRTEKYSPINCSNHVEETQSSDASTTASKNSFTNGNGLSGSDDHMSGPSPATEEVGMMLPGQARRNSMLRRPRERRPSSTTKPKEKRRSFSVEKPRRRSKAFPRFSLSPPRPKTRRSLIEHSDHGYNGCQTRGFEQSQPSDTSSDDSAVRSDDAGLIDRRLHRSSSQSLDVVDLTNDWMYDHCVGHPSNIVMADEDLEDFVTRMAGSKLSEEPRGIELCIFRRTSDHHGDVGLPSTTLPFLSNKDHSTMKDMIKRLQEGSSGKRFLTFTKTEAKAIACEAEHIVFCLPQVKMRPQFDKDAFGAMKVSDVLAMTSERPLVVEVKLEEISKRGEQLNIY